MGPNDVFALHGISFPFPANLIGAALRVITSTHMLQIMNELMHPYAEPDSALILPQPFIEVHNAVIVIHHPSALHRLLPHTLATKKLCGLNSTCGSLSGVG
jgi:hypothetical protein